MLRLRKKHSRPTEPAPHPVDAQRLIDAQSLRRAALASVSLAILLNVVWLWLSNVTGSFFHWYSLLQGPLIGVGVQRAGRGIDWRFPLLAACVALVAAFSGNFLVSLMTTSTVLGVSAPQVLQGLTAWTWQTWYAEVLSPVDLIYALAAAAIAAFYSRRRLSRQEIFALRTMPKDRKQ
jgi:hypothetical protein